MATPVPAGSPIPATPVQNGKKIPIRPGNVQAELEALRQRGLATLLNKHFTDEITKLAQEKAAADAALRDLEQRKAQTSEFQASGDGAISPMDALFVSVNNWRKECRRKEKETLLLYQRYVDRFGSSGVPIQVPGVNNNTTSKSPNVLLVPGQSPATTSNSYSSHGSSPTWAAAPPPNDTPPYPKRGIVSTTAGAAAPGPCSPTKVQVHSMAAAIEQTLDDYLKQGALELPSIRLLGKEETFSQHIQKQETEFRNYYRRQLELKGVDAKANDEFLQNKNPYGPEEGPTTFLTLLKGSAAAATAAGGGMVNNHNIHDGGGIPEEQDEEEEEDDDDDYSGEGQDGLGPLFIHHAHDDDSVVSGLTFNSALTREILDDCERTVVTFLKEEKEAIRKIMEEEGGATDDALTAKSMPSQVGSASNQAAAQAETMVQQMQEILDNFREDATVVGTVTKEARHFDTKNPNEKWMVYYDEYYQREYYHELNSNRTQWEPPLVLEDGVAGDEISTSHQSINSRSTPLLSSQEVMPERTTSTSNATSRIELYRRKRRRQRRRRRIVAALIVSCLAALATVVYYYQQQSASDATQQPAAVVFLTLPMMMWSHVQTTLLGYPLPSDVDESEEVIRQKREQQEAERQAELARALERERLAKEEEEAARQAQEEADRRRAAKEEAERLAHEEKVRLAKEEARKTQELLERLKREQEQAREALDFRVGGRVPMAYFVQDLGLMVKVGSRPYM